MSNQDEETEAQGFQDSKDDEATWGEPVPPNSRRRLNAVVSVRFEPGELEVIRGAAKSGNVSQFIRQAALEAASQPASWSADPSFNSSVRHGGATVVVNSVIQFPDPVEGGMNLFWQTPSQLEKA
jgi:hypothetical protein